jgi:histidinol-phosphate/aromatic aminotransferase/cobyric acid decarboxylase-like protein
VLAAVTPRVKLIFLCSPGNPTAKLVPLDVVEQVLQGGESASPVGRWMDARTDGWAGGDAIF